MTTRRKDRWRAHARRAAFVKKTRDEKKKTDVIIINCIAIFHERFSHFIYCILFLNTDVARITSAMHSTACASAFRRRTADFIFCCCCCLCGTDWRLVVVCIFLVYFFSFFISFRREAPKCESPRFWFTICIVLPSGCQYHHHLSPLPCQSHRLATSQISLTFALRSCKFAWTSQLEKVRVSLYNGKSAGAVCSANTRCIQATCNMHMYEYNTASTCWR